MRYVVKMLHQRQTGTPMEEVVEANSFAVANDWIIFTNRDHQSAAFPRGNVLCVIEQ